MEYLIFSLIIGCFYACSNQSQPVNQNFDNLLNDSMVIQKSLIDSLVTTIADNYDMLHMDYTNSVHKLSTLGIPAIEAVLPLLNSPKKDTRLYAVRVVEWVIGRHYGWIPGQGYTIKEREDTVRSVLNFINYNWEDTVLEKRHQSIEQLKIWVAKNKKNNPGQ